MTLLTVGDGATTIGYQVQAKSKSENGTLFGHYRNRWGAAGYAALSKMRVSWSDMRYSIAAGGMIRFFGAGDYVAYDVNNSKVNLNGSKLLAGAILAATVGTWRGSKDTMREPLHHGDLWSQNAGNVWFATAKFSFSNTILIGLAGAGGIVRPLWPFSLDNSITIP